MTAAQVAILIGCLALTQVQVGAQVISARAGMVKNVRGQAFYRCHLDDRTRELKKGFLLHNGDVLISAGASTALTLDPDAYFVVSPDSVVRVKETALEAMRFDIDRGEILIVSKTMGKDVILRIHTPPTVLTISKPGLLRISVAENGNTEANVAEGELEYMDEYKRVQRIGKGRQVNFVKKK